MPSDTALPTAPTNQDAAAIPYQRCDARHSPPGTPGPAAGAYRAGVAELIIP
ncbi:hypothetical protein [Actinomadura sp. BRA 177]|uniref:hypothetical protein n=1 Tax=Actinomadura sp. BRA 177 TaxID=2745202 RepID=UPI0020CEFB56|nr:hypothetical protein [Actinomadura sp. BRA 177]